MSNYCFIILCTFPTIFCWRQPIFFPSFFWNQNWLGFKKILEIKVLDKSIVSKKRQKNFMRNNSNSNLLYNEKKHAQQKEKKVEVKKVSKPRFCQTFSLSCVLNSSMFPIIFYKFWTCSNNFLFKCLLVTSYTYSSLYVVCLFFIKNSFWSSISTFIFRHSYYKKIVIIIIKYIHF